MVILDFFTICEYGSDFWQHCAPPKTCQNQKSFSDPFNRPPITTDLGCFLFWTKYVLLGYPSVCIRGKTAQIGPNGTKQARFCVLYAKEDTGLRKVNLHWWWRWWLIWTRGGDLEEWRQRTFSDFGDLSLVNTFPHAVKFQLPNSPSVNWKRG